MNTIAVDDALFAKYRDLIYREAGIALTDMKKALLVGRLAGRLRELRLPSLESYYEIVSDPAAVDERKKMLDRICTNETQFFRDGRQFQYLDERVFPLIEARADAGQPRRVRAWSAACSTGEEPYSLAMSLLARFPPESGWKVEVVATDLSTKVLRAAQAPGKTTSRATAPRTSTSIRRSRSRTRSASTTTTTTTRARRTPSSASTAAARSPRSSSR